MQPNTLLYGGDIDVHVTHCNNNQFGNWMCVSMNTIIITVDIECLKQPQARLLAVLETGRCKATKLGEVIETYNSDIYIWYLLQNQPNTIHYDGYMEDNIYIQWDNH